MLQRLRTSSLPVTKEIQVLEHYVPAVFPSSRFLLSTPRPTADGSFSVNDMSEVEAFCSTSELKVGLESEGIAAVDHSASRDPLSPTAPSFSVFNSTMERPDERVVEVEGLANEMGQGGSVSNELGEPEGVCHPTRATWHASGFPGEPTSPQCRDVLAAEAAPFDRECPGGRASSPSVPVRGGSEEEGRSSDWTERRLAKTQRRIARAMRSHAHRVQGRGHRGPAEREVEAAPDRLEESEEGCSSKSRSLKSSSRNRSISAPRMVRSGRSSTASRLSRWRSSSPARRVDGDGGRSSSDDGHGLDARGSSEPPSLSDGHGDHQQVGHAEAEDENEMNIRQSIGKMNPSSFKDMKRGLRQQVHQGVRKVRRLESALGTSSSAVRDVMESSYERAEQGVIRHPELFLTEVQLPADPELLREERQREQNFRFLRCAQVQHGEAKKRKDMWHVGRSGLWVCRRHHMKRTRLFQPAGGTLPYIPANSFTGRRCTVVYGSDDSAEPEELYDNFLTDSSPSLARPWYGETWLELKVGHGPASWPAERWTDEQSRLVFFEGSHVMENLDKMYVATNTYRWHNLALPPTSMQPVSTWMYLHGEWQHLEDRVPFAERQYTKWCAQLVEKAEYFVTILHHESHPEALVGERIDPDCIFAAEIFTDTAPVLRAAHARGHKVMEPLTLPEYDFYNEKDRQRCGKLMKEEAPFAAVIAFPCVVWSPLQRIGRNKRQKALKLLRRKQKELTLTKFAARQARAQLDAGRHFLLENPAPSAAWQECAELRALRNDPRVYSVKFDQCQFGLRGPQGGLHRKRTLILTSSKKVADRFRDKLCPGDHQHEPVIGGSKVTRPAGHYPRQMAEAIVAGFEEELLEQFSPSNEAFAADGEPGDDAGHDDGGDDFEESEDDIEAMLERELHDTDPPVPRPPEEAARPTSSTTRSSASEPTKEQRQAVMRLHQNTGHRDPRRLAKALLVAGATPAVVRAARELRCDICLENKRPRSHRPSTLPKARHFGDQVHMDLFCLKDAMETAFWVCHAVDAASQFQVAKVLEKKSTTEVLKFLNESWISILGVPKTLICDSGPEFVSDEMQAACDFHDINLYHAAVEAPWVNGIAERGGQSLKTICKAVSSRHCPQGREEMSQVLAAACEAVNGDVGESGFSPAQFVLGRQPRSTDMVVPHGSRARLAQHSLLENTPSMERRIAMKECARVAMVRLKYSRALRRAELARARKPVMVHEYQPGDLVYFFREQKPSSQKGKAKNPNMRRKLLLRQWHGPAMVLTTESNSGGIIMLSMWLTVETAPRLLLNISVQPAL